MNREFTENDRNESRAGHRKNEESRFRGTRILPYAYWGCECQNERAPALGERYSRHREAGLDNEGSRWRPKAYQRASWTCAIEEEMNKQISLESERSIRSISKERMILLFNSTIRQGGCQFVNEFVNFERRSHNDHPNIEQRYLKLEEERKNLARPG